MTFSVLLLSSLVLFGSLAGADESFLMRYPDVHQDRVVFTYEGDLWLAPTEGGQARRLTNHPGLERDAKFSPDGEWIAFTGSYDGGNDVYVVPAEGGVPRRLTFHPSRDGVLGWTPDGKVLFRSRREYPYNAERLFVVAPDGGMPQALNVDRAGLACLSPDGTRLAYNRITREERTWKRHQGGTAQDLWMGSLEDGDYKRITDWPGSDNFPMWQGDTIYFASDRHFGTMNLYGYDTTSGEIRALTEFTDYDVKFPSIGPGAIIFQYGESLHLLDLATGAVRPVEISLSSDLVAMRDEYVPVSGASGSFGLDPSAERLAVESRGEIMIFPVEDEEPVVNLTARSGSREKSAAWSPDGSKIVFISDRSGEEELWLAEPEAGAEWRQLTRGGLGYRMQPVWSPDGKHILFGDKALRLNLVEVASGDITVIDQGEYDDAWYRWGIQDYVWSPDSRWVAYSKMEQSMNDGIFLYSMDSGTTTRLTSQRSSDWSPSFSPDGRYLYFLSNRTLNPVMGAMDLNHVFLDVTRPYLVLLRAGDRSPFAPGKDSGDEEKAEKKDDGDDDDGVQVDIDLDGIGQRILAVEGVEAGTYFRLEAFPGGFLYLSQEEPDFLKWKYVDDRTAGRLTLMAYTLEDEESESVLEGIANYHLSSEGDKLVYRAGSRLGVVDAGRPAKVGDGDVNVGSATMKVDLKQEFLQIFNEAWRIQRDWFYDPDMQGVDWVAMGEKYRRFVPFCGNRADLNYLIGEMIAELNIGHTYIYGGDFGDRPERIGVGLVGADFDLPEGAEHYRVRHIVPGTSWDPAERSPLAEPGCAVREGDFLVAVNGTEVKAGENLYKAFENLVNEPAELTFQAASGGATSACLITPVRSEYPIRYREWVENNRAAVDRASGGRIGYVHIPDMSQDGLVEFARGFYHQYAKEAMVIDVRYNGGGFVGNMIVDRLERHLWGLTQPREGRPIRDPERGFHGHLAVLINADAGSNAEHFAEAVKIRGLAPVIGTRTWGGAVGIEPHQDMVDGGGTSPPQFAPYSLDGKRWLIEGRGVDPDIEVENLPADVLAGRDTQLERTVELLLERLEAEPMTLPGPPPYEDRSKPSE